MSVHGTSRLHVVTEMMNSAQYLDVLERRYVPQLMEWYPDGNAMFMHDYERHVIGPGRLVPISLDETGQEVLPWPGNSPTMNPIEGLWKVLKDRVTSRTCNIYMHCKAKKIMTPNFLL